MNCLGSCVTVSSLFSLLVGSETQFENPKYKFDDFTDRMILSAGILTGMLLLIQGAFGAEFYNNSKMSVDVDPYMKTLAKRDLGVSPIVLDSNKYGLYPTTILTILRNPRLIGGMPPGIANFMLNQVLLSGTTKSGMVYPLFTKEALKFIDNEYASLVVDCNGDDSKKGSCKPGYQKVIVRTGKGSDCRSNPQTGKTYRRTTSTESSKSMSKTTSASASAPANTTTSTTETTETAPEANEEEEHN